MSEQPTTTIAADGEAVEYRDVPNHRTCEWCGKTVRPPYQKAGRLIERRFCGNSCSTSARHEAKRQAVPLVVRFFDNVIIPDAPGVIDQCWEWRPCAGTNRYGTFVGVDGKLRKATRALWGMLHGPIPHGLFVLHRCDNPPCVNPIHLFLGTNQDNMDDMVRKGRAALMKGEANPRARLTREQVAYIRSDEARCLTHAAIARQFGVTYMAVSRIRRGRSWVGLKEVVS